MKIIGEGAPEEGDEDEDWRSAQAYQDSRALAYEKLSPEALKRFIKVSEKRVEAVNITERENSERIQSELNDPSTGTS